MGTVARRDFQSIPQRDALATWVAIVDLLTAGSNDTAKRQELMKVSGVASSLIADQSPRISPIIACCDGTRTRIYCNYDDEALDDSNSNEAKLGYDALKGDWEVSLPCAVEDLAWVQSALKQHSSRIVARDQDQGIDTGNKAQADNDSMYAIDVEGFMKS